MYTTDDLPQAEQPSTILVYGDGTGIPLARGFPSPYPVLRAGADFEATLIVDPPLLAVSISARECCIGEVIALRSGDIEIALQVEGETGYLLHRISHGKSTAYYETPFHVVAQNVEDFSFLKNPDYLRSGVGLLFVLTGEDGLIHATRTGKLPATIVAAMRDLVGRQVLGLGSASKATHDGDVSRFQRLNPKISAAFGRAKLRGMAATRI